MKAKVFLLTISWMLVTLVVIGLFHFPIINRIEYGQELNQSLQTSQSVLNQLDHTFKSLKLDIESFSKDLDGDVLWLDQSLKLLDENKSIKEVHLFDEDRLHDRTQVQKGSMVQLEKKSLEGLFFYQSMIVETYDKQRVIIYYKGKTTYLMLLINLDQLMNPALPTSKGMVGIYDQHSVLITSVGERLNGRTFFDDSALKQSNSGYVEEVFYSIQRINFENMPLNILIANLDQTYRKHVRLYLVRYVLLSLVIITVGFLVAWRIVKVYQQAVLNKQLGQITELGQIQKNISLAITHMGMAAKSFDDINVLKEELETLYVDLEEGVNYDADARVDEKGDQKT